MDHIRDLWGTALEIEIARIWQFEFLWLIETGDVTVVIQVEEEKSRNRLSIDIPG